MKKLEQLIKTPLTRLIADYYDERGLVWPSFDDAMKFVVTEMGEAYEIDLARGVAYVRNNPAKKPKFSVDDLGTELGDAIMMLIVAGLVEGIDPIECLTIKLKKKMKKQHREGGE